MCKARSGRGTPHVSSHWLEHSHMATHNCKQGREMKASCNLKKKKRIWVLISLTTFLPFGSWENLVQSPLLPTSENCVFKGSSGIPFLGGVGALSFYGGWQTSSDRGKCHRVDLGISWKVFRWSANLYWRNKKGWPSWNSTHKCSYLSSCWSPRSSVPKCLKSWQTLPFHLSQGNCGLIFANKNNSSAAIAYLLFGKTAGIP